MARRKSKKSSKSGKSRFFLVIILVIAAIGAAYIFFGDEVRQAVSSVFGQLAGSDDAGRNSTLPSGTGDDTDSKSGDATGSGTGSAEDTGSGDISGISDITRYLPKPYMKFVMYNKGYEGIEERIEEVTGIIPDYAIVSVVEMILDSEVLVVHFKQEPEGIISFMDGPEGRESFLWLPADLRKGYSWSVQGVEYKILDTAAVCDLGFTMLNDCIEIETSYADDGTVFIEYIAPGFGLVQIKEKSSSENIMYLKSFSAIGTKEANDLLARYAPDAVGSGASQ